MPILLSPDRAPSLDALLAQADTTGLDSRIIPAPDREGGSLPRIQGIGTLAGAGAAEISFLTNRKYQSQLSVTRAAAVIAPPQSVEALHALWRADAALPRFALVVSSQPYLLYARIAQWFDAARQPAPVAGVHPSAVVAADAVIEAGASIGPHCVVESGARIGRGAVLGPGCIIGAGAVIGPDCLLYARVTLYHGVRVGARAILHSGVVLGADGFGFAPDHSRGQAGWAKIPQLGGVLVGDDVEIGANTAVDRGALEDTVIGNGVKLDDQIMVGHNARIGEHTVVAACTGIAGSTVIGARCIIGGAAMLSGHLSIADDVQINGATAVGSSLRKPGKYAGSYPCVDQGEWQRGAAVVAQLPALRRRLQALEKSLGKTTQETQEHTQEHSQE